MSTGRMPFRMVRMEMRLRATMTPSVRTMRPMDQKLWQTKMNTMKKSVSTSFMRGSKRWMTELPGKY